VSGSLKCPVCGGELLEREMEKLPRGGSNVAVVQVCAEVCPRCGERLYTPESVRWFERIRARLEREETEGFERLGQSFLVPS